MKRASLRAHVGILRKRARLGAMILVAALSAGGVGCGEEDSAPEPAVQEPNPPAGSSTDLRVAVDRRVELLSVLCRLAGVPPYGESTTPYAAEVDRHFAPSGRHPAVSATRTLAAEHGISHDAPATLAAYLDDSLQPVRPLSPLPPGLDPRWKEVDLDSYLRDVRRFAAESRFDAFSESQAGYHAAVEDAFDQFLAERPILDWFDDAFGPRPSASYSVVPGLLTGGFSFGTTAEAPNGDLDVAQIMFLEAPDADGIPHLTALTFEYLVHELAHSYVNPIFDARVNEMRASALPLFKRVEPAMRDQAYTSYLIMVNESVVRAITVLFLRDRASEEDAQRSLDLQVELSFLWTPELVEAIEAQRQADGGRLEAEALVRITQEVFTGWLEGNP